MTSLIGKFKFFKNNIHIWKNATLNDYCEVEVKTAKNKINGKKVLFFYIN